MYGQRRCAVVALSLLALVVCGCESPPTPEAGERPVAAPAAEIETPAPDAAGEGAPAPEAAPEVAPAPEPSPGPTSASPVEPVREPYAAGAFYASDPDELRREVSGYVAAAKKVDLPGRVMAIIAPHAGYGFSGPAAGWAYRQLEGADVETVVVIGGHAGGMGGAVVWPRGAWKTPLGAAAVDAELAAALVGEKDGGPVAAELRPHLAPVMGGNQDQALEVQVPFIQVVLPGAKIVPVYFNTDDPAEAARVGEALAGAMAGRKAVIVASTDLSHYPDADTAAVVDKAILDAIVSLDAERIVEADRRLLATYRDRNLGCTVCGMGAVLATVEAAKRLGATGARLVAYDHSGNRVRKDRSRVVGYGAVAIYGPAAPGGAGRRPSAAGRPAAAKDEPAAAGEKDDGRMLTDQERAMLLALARKSVELALEKKEVPPLAGLTEALEMKTGAFVTIQKRAGGRLGLRGCIGTFDRSKPLWQVVVEFARHAAFSDRRFEPLTKAELGEVEFEISVLSPLRKLDNPLDIRLGTDGIWIVGADGETGTYLPQVAEHFKTKEEFLSDCSANKAYLPADAWRDPRQATVYAYTAEVFSEGELRAKAGNAGKPEE